MQWWGAEELSRGREAGGPSSGIVRIRSMTPVSKWIHARLEAPGKHLFSWGRRPAANGMSRPMTQKERGLLHQKPLREGPTSAGFQVLFEVLSAARIHEFDRHDQRPWSMRGRGA